MTHSVLSISQVSSAILPRKSCSDSPTPDGTLSHSNMALVEGCESADTIVCINCRQQIQHRLHIKCCECPAMLCVDCFSYGCEAGRHVRGHNYEIRDPLGGRTFGTKDSWGAVEEQKLLEAAYRFKLGSWGEVTRMMETNRPLSQVQEYYDRFFIRSPIGQLSLQLLNWKKTKNAMIADSTLRDQCAADRITYIMLAMDALTGTKEKLNPEDGDLTSKIDRIVQDYISYLESDSYQQSHSDDEIGDGLLEINDMELSDDSCDPSDAEMDRNKPPEDAYSTGLEPENDSDEDDSNKASQSRPLKVCGTKSAAITKSGRKLLGPSIALTRSKMRCGLRKSTLQKIGRISRYRRVQTYSSSTEEDCATGDDGEAMEIDQASQEDVQESMHGLEREDTTDDYTASDSEELKPASVQRLLNPTSSVRRRKRAKFSSKKARRLKHFQKRIARMTKDEERRLNELAELCPAEKVHELRASKPELSLYSSGYSTKPKVRQSDMDMLAYNARRNDFEWDWCNDAEILVSRMMIEESSDRVEDFENDIKFARIERYNRILKIRKAYRRAIVEHDKIPEFFKFMMNMTMEKRKASEIFAQRTPLEKLIVRAQQCLTKREVEDLRSHIDRTDELIERIAKLQELQRNGVCTLKEAVFLVNVLCWTRILMDSLPSLLFINTMVELYFIFAFSSLLLLKKNIRCHGMTNIQVKMKYITCSLESKIQEDVYVDEIVVDGPQKSSLQNLVFHKPCSRVHRILKSFKLRECMNAHNIETPVETSQGSTASTSSSVHTGNYPVIVEAVLAANTVEDIADTHPDFARLLMDCYSAGCDLEEYKREFQRLKNLRIKRQGGVNQTLSFSLFPSVPSDLPGHLFVRLLRFHSLYEGACRKYLTDVVNRRAEASAGFPFNLSRAGIQDIIQGNPPNDFFAPVTANQSVIGPYHEQDFHFPQPSASQAGMTDEVSYSPAFNSSALTRVSVATSSTIGAHLSNNEANSASSMQRTASMHVYSQGDGLNLQEEVTQPHGVTSFLEQGLAATPLPSWSQQESIVSGLRSQMATPLPPLEIRQCPVLRSELTTGAPRVEGQAMQTPIHHIQARQFSTPIPQVECRQSYAVVPTMQTLQYHSGVAPGMRDSVGGDNRRVMTAAPMREISDMSSNNQVAAFATPTKKPRTRRKVPMVPLANQSQPQQSLSFQSRLMTATPIPGWHQHQASKSVMDVQEQAIHEQSRNIITSSALRQSAASAPNHREIMNSTPMSAWMPQVQSNNTQGEGNSLVSSLPPLSQFTPPQPQQRHMKVPYPSVQNRQIITPSHHGQSGEVASGHQYEQSSHVYSQSREMVTPVPFAQGDLVSVTYGEPQNLSSQLSSTATEMYQQQAVPYQWPTGASVNVYRQQPQFVQQPPYEQQSQFDQQIITGNQSQVAFVGNQSTQYSTQSVRSQQPQYLQPVDVQKVSAFSQPFSYVQQSYPASTVFQQQSHYSQGPNFSHYSQRSPCAQADQQQQQHYHHQNVQQQHIHRQIYDSSAQFDDQYGHLVSAYNAQSACGVQNTHHVEIQRHQLTRSCEVANVGVSHHVSDISLNKQQETPNFACGVVDMNGSSSSGIIVEMIQSHEAMTSNETLEANLDQSSTSYSGMVSSSISGAVLVEPSVDGELRTFDITECPPPPRNDSEATVPARTTPNSCSPGMMAADDESSSLIPTFFYPKDFSQNDLCEMNIHGSPAEKGLNCQHFRFDIILAMKHHRIKKEDYERTLFELDQMEKEQCVGPLGDMLMKRLGLKRQLQQSHEGSFSVDELVAAFAANAKIRESNAGSSERRGSYDLFSEFVEDTTQVPSNASANIVVKRDSILNHQTHNSPIPRSDVLHSVDAMTDLNYLISDDIAGYDSVKPATLSAHKSLSVAAPEPLFNVEQPSMCTSPRLKAPLCDETPIFADMSCEFNSGPLLEKRPIETSFLVDGSHAIFSDPSDGTSFSCGQPAAPATFSSSSSTILSVQPNVSLPETNVLPSSGYCETLRPSSVCTLPNLKTSESMVSRKSSPERDPVLRTTLSFGAPAQPARRSCVFSRESFEEISPLIISPEPLSDEGEWWRKDDPTPPMLEKLNQIPEATEPLSTSQQFLRGSECSTSHKGEFGDDNVVVSASKEDNDDDDNHDIGETDNVSYFTAEGDNNDNGNDDAENDSAYDKNKMNSVETVPFSKHCAKMDSDGSISAKQLHSSIEKSSRKDLETPESSMSQRSEFPKSSSDEKLQRILNKSKSVHVKKRVKKKKKSLLASDFSSETSKEESGSKLSRSHPSASFSNVSRVFPKKPNSPHTRHAAFSRCVKKKVKKSSVALKASKESVLKSAPSKVELSREMLAKQIAEIIEEERSKLPPDESKLPKRQLSPATLNVVIQDLMQHHISEDSSPSRDLFASKLLGREVFSKLFFRAGKCVFRHYEELDDLRSKEKGKGRRRGGTARKRDTELLRGIRKSREIQRHRDAIRAAKEPSEAEKAAAAEKAKLEAMPWLARSTFKPDIQQGTSSRFVIPKKSGTSATGLQKSGSSLGSAIETKLGSILPHNATDIKVGHQKVEEGKSEQKASSNEKGVKKIRSPPLHSSQKSYSRLHHGEGVSKIGAQVNSRKIEEVSTSFSFYGTLKFSSSKARVKYTWPLKRCRSASALIEESLDVTLDRIMEEQAIEELANPIVSSGLDMDSFSGVSIGKPSSTMLGTLPTASYVSESESQLAALALQEEMSRSEQGSPDDQFAALRYLAAMPESEFTVTGDNSGSIPSVCMQSEAAKSKQQPSDEIEMPLVSCTSEETQVDDKFEYVDWMRADHVQETFFPADFEVDPWHFSSSSVPLTDKYLPESIQVASTASNVASLYSSLQEELDSIVRDTLGEALYSPESVEHVLPIAPIVLERFEWPKADVPFRSYALDIVLPKLSCDKAKIPILDLCCCERCLTRCVYYCDDDEWKCLYDSAISRRKQIDSGQYSYRQLSSVLQVCSMDYSLHRKSESRFISFTWSEYAFALQCQSLSLVGTNREFYEFMRRPASEFARVCCPLYHRALEADEFTGISVQEDSCSLRRQASAQNAEIVWAEFQSTSYQDGISTFRFPEHIVLEKRSCQETVGSVQPIYQKLFAKCSMTLTSVMNMDFHCIGPSGKCQITIPVPKLEVFSANIVDVQLLYVRECNVLITKAVINIPRTSPTFLAICSSNATFGTPRWICENSNYHTRIELPYALFSAEMLCTCHLNVRKKRPNSFTSNGFVLPIHRLSSTSLTCYQQTETFLRTSQSFSTQTSLPLPVLESISYRYCNLKVRRKRSGMSACTFFTVPISLLEAFLLTASAVYVERKRRESEAVAEISVPQSREELSVLNVCELKVQRCHQGFAESVIGVFPLPRKECTILNILMLNVWRKKMGFSRMAQTKLDIPRTDSLLFSIAGVNMDYTRESDVGASNRVISISRDDAALFRSCEMRIKRRRRPALSYYSYCAAVPRQDSVKMNIYDLLLRYHRHDDCNHFTYIHPVPRVCKTTSSVTARNFNLINSCFPIFDCSRIIDIPSEELTNGHFLAVNVHRCRRDQLSVIRHISHYSDTDFYKLTTLKREKSFSKDLIPDDVHKNCSISLPIPRKLVEILRLSTVRMFRKRKYEEAALVFVKRLALEDRADLFLTEKCFYGNSNRITEVVFIKDPRGPVKCTSSFMEVSMRWRNFAHRHIPHLVFSSYIVTQFALLLQRVFTGAVERCTISMKEISSLISNTDGRYDLDIFTNPEKILIADSVSSGLIWDGLMELRSQRNSTELLNRKSLAPLFIFLGRPTLPRIGRPWRRWLKPLETTSDSRIGCQLALCMRIPDLIGVDDMDAKLQAIKMWWTFMMLRGTVPWFLYPCFSRRQLFILVRLLEALEKVERPPFCLYPPKLFFKAVKKILSHPRMDLIPKDVYHPDITTMATLLRMNRNRVFHVDRSLPELLSHWMDDMNKIDAYLADDVTVSAICPSKFLTQSEWAWKNYNQGCVPEGIEYNRSISVEETIDKLTECLTDVALPLEQRKKISVLRTALSAWSKYDNGPSVDQIPVDIVNPFALSPSLIAMLPMPKHFVDECFVFLEKVSKKSSRPCQNPTRKSTKSSPNWSWRPSERLACAGKLTNAGTKANGKTTISTLFEEFWKSPKVFSPLSVFDKKESMTLEPRIVKKNITRDERLISQDKTELLSCHYENRLLVRYDQNCELSGKVRMTSEFEATSVNKSTVKKKERQSSSPPYCHAEGKVPYLQRPRRRRRRNDAMIDDTASLTLNLRPRKKLKFETRKRSLIRTSDEEGPSSAKHSMKKIPEHRQVKLRHTLARKGAETEKMVNETVSRACAIVASQGSSASLMIRSAKRRKASEFPDSDSRSETVASSHPLKPRVVKKSRPATIFDVTNFEWVLEMSLRRPRAFVGLYKRMKYQYRILEKRRWVEKNRELYSKAQFEKFLRETCHSEVELLEKAKLLKAEKDMERVLGVSRLEAERTAKFAIKDLAYWYDMSRRYTVQAEALANETLEKARRLDMALDKLRRKDLEARKHRIELFSEISMEEVVSATLSSLIESVETIVRQEMEQHRREVQAVEETVMDLIKQVDKGAYGFEEASLNEITKTILRSSSRSDMIAFNTMTLTSTCVNSYQDCNGDEYCDIDLNDIVNNTINTKSKGQQSFEFTNRPVQPLFHMQSRLPLTCAYISMGINAGGVLNPQIPFQPRFKRPRRVDNEVDLLPPGDFSPYSTDEEWEDYYEKKDRFESCRLPQQLSWSSFRLDNCDDDYRTSELAWCQSCNCSIANERTMNWVAKLSTISTRKCHSMELLPRDNLCIKSSLQRIPLRSYSTLSCISLERLPILKPATSNVNAEVLDVVGKCQRKCSLQSHTKLLPSSRQRSMSLSPSWKPRNFCLSKKVGTESLCESRRNRLMYQRALSACRFHVYDAMKLLIPGQQQRRNIGDKWIRYPLHRESDLPQQWIRRNSSYRHDFIRMARYKLEIRSQRSIPVLWSLRPDHCESPPSSIGGYTDNSTQISRHTASVESPECQLECPVAVYNTPPTWNTMMWSQSGKRTNIGESLKYSPSEPSAFQRVLARPQPIDISKLDVELETDDDSNDKIPQWPLLKKLRGMERELLAAGNPVAVERQKIREYNRQIRYEMHERDELGEQMRQLQQLYLGYFTAQQLFLAQIFSASYMHFTQEQQGMIENMEEQQELDERWYSLLREEQQLTRRRTRDAVLTDMLFLRPESYEMAHQNYFAGDRIFLPHVLGAQHDGSSKCYQVRNTSMIASDLPQVLDQSQDRSPDEEEMSIEVLDVEPEDSEERITGVVLFEDCQNRVDLMHKNSSGGAQGRSGVSCGATADPNIDTERESTGSNISDHQQTISHSSSPTTSTTSLPKNRAVLSPEHELTGHVGGDDSTSPEL
ncbi:hypothetical protein KIN20_004083 [Parelaphostrongylus tenuis]|uniref:SANT domain-containing protein n=1 Tax=Parelaphostrongylus tenuis TaxID=148309 RepID=A0AAD5QEV5_PARTN|nr:hypothetical protein KIN20_004083 [Parelaphostrongylus tenuis]